MFVASLVGLAIPLLPVQILWINLITGGLPGLALAAVTVIGFSQLAHVLANRSEDEALLSIGVFSNVPLFAAVTATALLQLAVVYIPILNRWFKMDTLTSADLGICVLMGFTICCR